MIATDEVNHRGVFANISDSPDDAAGEDDWGADGDVEVLSLANFYSLPP